MTSKKVQALLDEMFAKLDLKEMLVDVVKHHIVYTDSNGIEFDNLEDYIKYGDLFLFVDDE